MFSLRTTLAALWLAFSAIGAFAGDSAAAVAPGLVLGESERVYIAKIEHRGLTLNQKAFPVITAAIRGRDAQKLTSLFAPDFAGQTIDPTQGSGPRSEILDLRRVTSADKSKCVSADA